MVDNPSTEFESPTPSAERGTIAYLAVAGIQRVAGFALLPVFASALTPAGYGTLAVLLSAHALAFALLPAGMETYVWRMVFTTAKDTARTSGLSSIVTFLVAGPVVVGGLLGLVAVMSPPLFDVQPRYLAAYLLGAGLMVAGTVAPHALLRANEQFGAFATLSLGCTAAQLLLRLGLVVGLDRGVAGIVLADLLASVLAAIAGIVSARSSLTLRSVDRSAVRLGLRFGLPLVPHSISHWVLNLSDRFVMAAFLTPALVGVYSMSYQLANLASIAVTEVERAFMPRYGEVLRGRRSVGNLVAQQAGTVIGLCGITALLGPQVVHHLLPVSYAGAADYVPLFALGFACLGLYYVPMNVLVIIEGQTNKVWRWTAISGAANVGVNLALVPAYGIAAGALATIIGYALLLVLVSKAAMKINVGAFHPRQLLRPVVPGLLVSSVFSIAAVRAEVTGLVASITGCCLLTILTWREMRRPSPGSTA